MRRGVQAGYIDTIGPSTYYRWHGDPRRVSKATFPPVRLVPRPSTPSRLFRLPQTRPCDARDLRARESTATASARTTPVIMKRMDDDRLSKVSPLEIAEMTKIPSSAE